MSEKDIDEYLDAPDEVRDLILREFVHRRTHLRLREPEALPTVGDTIMAIVNKLDDLEDPEAARQFLAVQGVLSLVMTLYRRSGSQLTDGPKMGRRTCDQGRRP